LDRRTLLRRGITAGAGTAVGAWSLNEISPVLLPERPVWDVNHSLWMRFQPPHNPPLTTDLDVDVAVIGGGYTGLSAAYHITRTAPNRHVVVLEARGVGNRASGRNGARMQQVRDSPGESWPLSIGIEFASLQITGPASKCAPRVRAAKLSRAAF